MSPAANEKAQVGEYPLIFKAMNDALRKITPIPKDKENLQQHFKFRGIDATLSAVNPALDECGLIYTQNILEERSEPVATNRGGSMNHTVLKVEFTFYALDGSSLRITTMGEAFDSGDKSYTKAQSVALRTCLLNTFAIPTGDADPDETSYERTGTKPQVALPEKEVMIIQGASSLEELSQIRAQIGESDLADDVKHGLGLLWKARVEDVGSKTETKKPSEAKAIVDFQGRISEMHAQMSVPERLDFFSNVIAAGLPSIENGTSALNAEQQARVVNIAQVILDHKANKQEPAQV